MKLLSVIEVGPDTFHIAATRSPDLLRRELFTQYGEAYLRLCTVLPDGFGADRIATALQAHFSAVGENQISASLHDIRRFLWRLTVAEPKLRKALRRVRKLISF